MNPRVKLLAAFIFSVTAVFLALETRAQAGLPDCYYCWYELSACRQRCDEDAASCNGNADEEYWVCLSNGTPEQTCAANYNNKIVLCDAAQSHCYNHCGLIYNFCCGY